MEQVEQFKKRKGKREIDMTEGKLFPKILAFSLPLIATGVLQLLFNAADMMVVGKFVGDIALASVGATASIINLLVTLFMGLSIGAGIMMSRHYGAKNPQKCFELVHTAMPLSLILGIVVALIGFFVAPEMLHWVNTPEECLPLSALYLSIYFIGTPFVMIYNFGAAILRAIGDTLRPLIFLAIAGVVNVVVNVITVVGFNMGVAGVAYATITSQAISAVLVGITLIREKGVARYEIKKSKFYKRSLIDVLKLGIPSGLQGALFSVSNLIIQSTINGIGPIAMSANTASANLEGFVYIAMNSVSNTAATAVGQNYGAGDFKRVRSAAINCVVFSVAFSLSLSMILLLFQNLLISLYISTPESIELAKLRMSIILPTYFLCGVMDLMSNSMRGMGYSLLPMIITLIGTCVFRILWVYLVFPLNPVYKNVILSYPISWLITATISVLVFILLFRRKKKRAELSAKLVEQAQI